MRRSLTEDQGDTTTGVALGAIIVLLVIVVLFLFNPFQPQPQQPGVDIRVGT